MPGRPLTRRALIRRAAALPLIGAGAGAALAARPAAAAQVSLRLATSFSNDPAFSAARVWFDKFEERLHAHCGDQVVVKFFPDSQLGKEADIVGQIKLGVVDMMISGSSIWATVAPEIGLLDLGYLFKDFAHQTRALEGDTSRTLDRLLAERGGVQVLGWAYNLGSRNFFTKFPFQTPAELAGKKIRSLPTPAVTETVRLMGAAATPLAFGEIYTALQTGVIDGLEHDAPTILAGKFYEAAKHLTLTRHIFNPLTPVIGLRSLQRVPQGLRDGFLAAAREATLFERDRALAIEADAVAALGKAGVTVADIDREPFRQRVRPLWNQFLETQPAAKPVLDAILKVDA